MPDDPGSFPDELDSCLAMGKGPRADVFGSGIEMALQKSGAFREREAFEGIVGFWGLLHWR